MVHHHLHRRAQVVAAVRSFGIKPTRTAYRSPWQNGVAERWIGSVRYVLNSKYRTRLNEVRSSTTTARRARRLASGHAKSWTSPKWTSA